MPTKTQLFSKLLDREGGLVGIISVDDLIQLLSEEMNELAKLISREQV